MAARRKYKFPNRAAAEAAFRRSEEQVTILSRLVADLQSVTTETGDHFGFISETQGDHRLIVRESGSGYVEGVLIFDPGEQKPRVTPIVDLADMVSEWTRLASHGGRDSMDIAAIAERALRAARKVATRTIHRTGWML